MANVNKIILIGNLTRDPELTYTKTTNTAVCDLGMAINHKRTGAGGQATDEVCFIDCRAFGKQAELLNQYLRKGRQLYVEGRLTFDQWTGKDGQKRSRHRVVVENFQFIGGDKDGGGQHASPRGESRPNTRPAAAAAPGGQQDALPADGMDGGIPF